MTMTHTEGLARTSSGDSCHQDDKGGAAAAERKTFDNQNRNTQLQEDKECAAKTKIKKKYFYVEFFNSLNPKM